MIFPQTVKLANWAPYLGQQQPRPAPLSTVSAEDLTSVPPFGLPMVQTGVIMLAGGLASGAIGIYMAAKGAQVIGKKIPPFWEYMFGTGGIGVALAVLGSVPLVALGVFEIAGGIIIKKKLDEAIATIAKYPQK